MITEEDLAELEEAVDFVQDHLVDIRQKLKELQERGKVFSTSQQEQGSSPS